MKLLWVSPEKKGGIQVYTDTLWPEIRKKVGGELLRELPSELTLKKLKPDIIHIQHEYGLFGSKATHFNVFPKWINTARKALPQTKFLATAHTVLPRTYRYTKGGIGRTAANLFWLPLIRSYWKEKTWGKLDGVIVHSQSQIEAIQESGCFYVAEIPHFVPEPLLLNEASPKLKGSFPEPLVVISGYITPEKGQDVAILAFREMKMKARLILAGGLRRPADRPYFEKCQKLMQSMNGEITGYLDPLELAHWYHKASIVVAPFRETSGSGSLAFAMAYHSAILASDLPLNLEIEKRIPGSVSFFQSGNPLDCAEKLDRLLEDDGRRESLKIGAAQYAKAYSLNQVVLSHEQFYLGLASGGK